MPQSRATIKDVAAAAGVSITTVSHALSAHKAARVAPRTRDRVRAVAADLGYEADALARTMRTQRSQSVGFISDEIATTPFAGHLVHGAQDALRARASVLLVATTEYHEDVERQAIKALQDRRVDGMLYAAMYHRIVVVPEALRGSPLVVVNARTAEPDTSWVVPDEVRGGWDAADVLLAAGHRRIAMINNVDDIPARDGREQGFRARCAEAGLPAADVVVEHAAAVAEGGYEASIRVLRGRSRPTGLFCFNDRMVMGAYRAAAELGLSIPVDLSVVGFDDLELISEGLYPGVTTLALPHYEMGVWAVEQLYAQIDAPAGMSMPVRTAELRCAVIQRASVTSPPPP
ncbi:LacI family DNA-binding transcriptional regulator [Cellulomonas sp. URHD0024]|uniref:LacI family DNA-binding transcriptional regulator n=1 Tax=Cellulomonas sp. URHD0024 TaxID=1302620 RepID=UPI0004242708|nr:LacI family DNA-binding transcriptional regulator [Cellulomonas sp. URHD0024]